MPSKKRAKRLPPGYRFSITASEQVSEPDSQRTVVRLYADDGSPVLTGSVSSVGQHDAVQVVDYFLREEIGDVIHADKYSMSNAAWRHYKLSVSWWHRYVTHYITTWAVVAAVLLGALSIVITLWAKSEPLVQTSHDKSRPATPWTTNSSARSGTMTEPQKAYLDAMARCVPGPHRTGDTARAMGKSSQQLGPTREALIASGMICSPRYGYAAFTVPLFDAFMKRIHG